MIKIIEKYAQGASRDMVSKELIDLAKKGEELVVQNHEEKPIPVESKKPEIALKSSPLDDILLERRKNQKDSPVSFNSKFNKYYQDSKEANLIFRSLKQCELGNTPEVLKKQLVK